MAKKIRFTYKTSPMVCSEAMIVEADPETMTIASLEVVSGCPGNLLGISKIVRGMKIDDVIAKFEGVSCGGKPTSCPDQLAQALKLFKAELAKKK